MSGLINELLQVLIEEAGLYDDLVKISGDKKKSIIDNDIDLLKGITCQENIIAGKMQRLEKKRLSIITDIANVLNEKEANITLSSLANIIIEQPESEKMKKVALHLKESLSTLKELNEQNKILIENALEYIDFSINVIRSSIDASPAIYSANGEQLSTGINLFDVKN